MPLRLALPDVADQNRNQLLQSRLDQTKSINVVIDNGFPYVAARGLFRMTRGFFHTVCGFFGLAHWIGNSASTETQLV